MANHFLTDIEVMYFKCFRGFKANGFKHVNLISGKNNVGKTAFMEACYINVSSKEIRNMIFAIITIKVMRENINLLDKINPKSKPEFVDLKSRFLDFFDLFNKCEIKSNVCDQVYFSSEINAIKKYNFLINNEIISINAGEINDISGNLENVNFIDNFGWSNSELINSYKYIQKNDQENELNSLINSFDRSIDGFKVIGDKPQCKIFDEDSGKRKYRDLTEFGDGLKRYISVICALHACENGYLFIDEIDNGIHYTQLDNLWELILTISKKTNCQVFASTHSKEMLESFARVAKKLEDKDVSFTTLVKNKNNAIKALTKDYEMLTYSIIDQEHEVR